MSDPKTDPNITLKQWHYERDGVQTWHEPGETGDYRAELAAVPDMDPGEYAALLAQGTIGEMAKPVEDAPDQSVVDTEHRGTFRYTGAPSQRSGPIMPPVNPVADPPVEHNESAGE